MKIVFLQIGCMVLLSSCNFSAARMTAPTFDSIAIGASITTVEEQAGAPYSVKEEKQGVQTYRYIERIQVGAGMTAQNTYLLTVVNGIIVDKQRMNESSSVNLQFQ